MIHQAVLQKLKIKKILTSNISEIYGPIFLPKNSLDWDTKFTKNFKAIKPILLYTQRNGPLSARGKSFCENPLDAQGISFGIKYIALEAKN